MGIWVVRVTLCLVRVLKMLFKLGRGLEGGFVGHINMEDGDCEAWF